jgi:hypothetical protein
MMRHVALLILISMASVAGCASQAARNAPASEPVITAPEAQGADEDGAIAASLVFDPPLTIGEPPVALAREDRQAGAFVGYQEQTVTSFWIQIDDRQGGSGNPRCDRYERRAFIVQTGATHR